MDKLKQFQLPISSQNIKTHIHTHTYSQLYKLFCKFVIFKLTQVLLITNNNKTQFINNKKSYCLCQFTLRRIKFQESNTKRIITCCNLAGLKLTTLSLVRDCKISSTLVVFFILTFYVVWIFLLPFQQVQDRFSVQQMYISLQDIRHGMKKQISQMNMIHIAYQTAIIPLNE